MASQLNTSSEQSIRHNEEMKMALRKAKADNIPVIALHTHPEGFPPSVDDFNSAFKSGYSLGVVVGHNGQVYLYQPGDEYIDEPDVVQLDIAMDCGRGVDVDRAHKAIYKEHGVIHMKKPIGVEEFDGYPMPDIPSDRKPLPKEEEDKIIAETIERIRQRKAAKALEKSRKIS